MSDTYRRYAAIQRSLLQFFPPLTGHRERHFNTLAALICGLAGAQASHLSAIANHAPAAGADQESLIMRFRRWLANDANTIDTWFLPVAKALLANLSSNHFCSPLMAALSDVAVSP